MFVDPRNFQSFCFRGEGRANFVISSKHRLSGTRIVWRFAKSRPSGLLTTEAHSHVVNTYMERIIDPLLEHQYLVDTTIVEFKTMDVHHLAKIPSLPINQKIEKFEDLYNLPKESSFLPIALFEQVQGAAVLTWPKIVTSLQMLDVTQLPLTIRDHDSATITVEIKPKQGFFQFHPHIDVPQCNNCILQIEKCWGQSHFSKMTEFCPLDLFSGSYSRMRKAIHSLFLVPHRYLRIFVDGTLAHSDEKPLEQDKFTQTLFPGKEATSQDLEMALCFALSGNQSENDFHLQKRSVLGQILDAQRMDPLGIVKAHALYEQLEPHLKDTLFDTSALVPLDMDSISNCSELNDPLLLSRDAQMAELRKYFVTATMKDCSVMVSFQPLPPNTPPLGRSDIVLLPNGRQFVFSIKVVDLDPKTPKNLINGHARFMKGVKIIKLNQENQDGRENFKPCKE